MVKQPKNIATASVIIDAKAPISVSSRSTPVVAQATSSKIGDMSRYVTRPSTIPNGTAATSRKGKRVK